MNFTDDPITEIRLVKCPISLDDKNQLTFSNLNSQLDYFLSLPHRDLTNATYQRRDSLIRYGEVIENLDEYNYVMYKNANYRNKWFFAFITSMKWSNNTMTDIFIKTDSFQTWQFDLEYKKSFIEREHVNDDTVGLHTVPENLETGEYVCNSSVKLYEGDANTTVCAMCSDLPDEVKDTLNINLNYYNGILNGCYIMCFDPENFTLAISNFLRAMDKLAKADAVISVFIVPNSLIEGTINYQVCNINVGGGHTISCKCGALPSTMGAKVLATSTAFSAPSTVDGYTPKNNKLRVWPYSYFYASNFAGTDVEFKYEEFTGGSCSFKTLGAITPGCSIRCVPLNYKKLSETGTSTKSFNAGIPLAKYPICSWKSDTYINWLTENGVNTGLQVAAGIGAIIGGGAMLATGVGALGGIGAIGGGVLTIANALATDYRHSLIPDQAKGNINTGDVTFSSGHLDIMAYKMSVRNEYAQIIDNFFTMFGYKVNRLKTPNITGRRNWNYIKSVDINIEAYIPQEDLQSIKDMFNNGVTLWHNASTFLDYSQNNDII